MPIKALKHRKPRLPIVGQLKKGAPKPDGRPGKDLDGYFRFVSQIPEAIQAFSSIYGNKPSNVKFYFPYNDFDSNFDTCQERYVKGKLDHRCDGEYVSLMKSNGRYIVPKGDTVPCPGGCDWRGTLSMAVSDEEFLRQFGGVIVVRLKGKTEIATIHSQLLAVHEDMGSLRGFEFELYRYDKKINQPNGMRVTKSLVGIRHNDAMLTVLSQPDHVDDYDYETDEDGVVIDDSEPIEAEIVPDEPVKQTNKPEPVRKPEPAKQTTTDYKALARAGNWAGAIAGIPRYAGDFPKFMGASQKIVTKGINNPSLTGRGEDAPELRARLFSVMEYYAKCKDGKHDEFNILNSIHAALEGHGLGELLKPIATDDFDAIPSASDATQAALIPNDDTPASQNAAMM